jgi:predicted deacylase
MQIEINGTIINPGENKTIKIKVAKLPSGTSINIVGHVFNAKAEGKRVLFLAGIHGDEVDGIEILRKVSEQKMFSDLLRGTVIVIPVLNVFGFINFKRDVPSGKDVNRSFPGNRNGSLASRVAKKLTEFILPNVEMIVDLHSGGETRYNYPQIRYTKSCKESFEIANIFNAPFIIEKAMIKGSLRKTARNLKIPTIVFEGGESGRFDEFAIKTGIRGINNILNHFNMISNTQNVEKSDVVKMNKTMWIRARDSGIINLIKKSGDFVNAKEPMAIIHDIYGEWSKPVLSPRKAYIIGHNNAPVVNMGDALFNIGWEIN